MWERHRARGVVASRSWKRPVNNYADEGGGRVVALAVGGGGMGGVGAQGANAWVMAAFFVLALVIRIGVALQIATIFNARMKSGAVAAGPAAPILPSA